MSRSFASSEGRAGSDLGAAEAIVATFVGRSEKLVRAEAAAAELETVADQAEDALSESADADVDSDWIDYLRERAQTIRLGAGLPA